MNILEYKGYNGSVEYSAEDGILFGKVLGINGLVSYEGESVSELKADFEGAVDDYIAACEEKGIEPRKTYRGCINVRLSPELHRLAVVVAQSEHISLNQLIEQSVRDRVSSSMN